MDVEKSGDSLSATTPSAEESRLAELGYTQELKRGFSLPGIVAFSFSIVTSWTALSGVLIVGVQSGGPPVMIWSWIGVCIVTLSVAYSLAEMCSAYPVAGGQYSWVAVFAPKKLRRGMSFLCGWFLNIGLLAMGATSHTASANFLLGLANLNNRDFEIRSWHNPLIAWAVALSSLIINVWGSKLLNKGSQMFLALNISSFVIVVVTILVMNGDRRPSSFVFSDFVNLTGWPPAYTALLGILQASYGMCCYDSASRMTEEIKDSRRQAPRAIVMSVYIGFVTGFVFLIAASYSMSADIDTIAGTSTGVPIMEIFYHATSTTAGATGLASLITIVGFGASFGLTATAGRSIYAFARDSGLPFSKFLSRVDSKTCSPVNALCCAVFVQMCLIAIQFGTATGFSTVIAIATEGFYVSYAFPLIARLLSLFTSQPARHIGGLYSLGQWSIPFNVVAVIYLLFTTITFNLPTVYPVSSENMNYTSAAVGAVMLIALVTWLTTGRKHFRGPESGGVAVATEGLIVSDGGPAESVNVDVDVVDKERKTVG
ncbi:Putative amino acid/polyamine transporter I, amino acid permease [Septoria linicola]|uniref:Amino acid/polyamine transporter I, amino acid permease n=1 Tax=Septoria linicola TaxID=215465 RepID=A0A9Q9ANF1_9PEZI|nr:putative amino acid/polyamine transporter I, amino acid permease [Septoria linicola]USW49161.1 Putative amino acid/polyamine transporter I, amino acid permease [Septoria linicola]